MADLDLWKYADVGKISIERGDENWDDIEEEVNAVRARIAAVESEIGTLQANFGERYLGKAVASGAAAIEFTDIDDTYDEYVFRFVGIEASATAQLNFHVSSDNGSSFITGSNMYQTSINMAAPAAANSFILAPSVADSAVRGYNGSVRLYEPAAVSSKFKSMDAKITGYGLTGRIVQGSRNSTGAADVINAVQFAFHTGTITGTIKMFGINKGA